MKEKHPRGLYVLFFSEMWERFSFYLMLGILLLYCKDYERGGLGLTQMEASRIYGSYIALVYFTPFLGGLLADRYLGYRKAIIVGGVSMAIGHGLLAFPGMGFFYAGLVCLCIGNGFFKPNISTLVGKLYPPGSKLRDRGFNIFYMGINIGACACNFVAALLRQNYGWHAAFGSAGVGMVISLLIFISFQRMFKEIDDTRHEKGEEHTEGGMGTIFSRLLLPAIAGGAAGWFLFDEENRATMAFIFGAIPVAAYYIWVLFRLKGEERRRISALYVIFLVVIIFWAIFHQNGSALTAWARDNTRRVPGETATKVMEALRLDEEAPASYFANAGPDVPRHDPSTYEVLTDEEYEAWREEMKTKRIHTRGEGEPDKVTQEDFDAVYAGTAEITPYLPPGEKVKLVSTEIFQSINPFCVIIFTPIVVFAWRFLSRRGREPSNPAKIGLGMVLTGLSTVVMLTAVIVTHDGAVKASAGWLIGTYAVVTFGELCLSPMGLSLVSKLSPKSVAGLMMGGWFVATSLGNKLAGVMGEWWDLMSHIKFFIIMLGGAVFAAGIVFWFLPWLREAMPAEVAEEPAGDPAGDPGEESAG